MCAYPTDSQLVRFIVHRSSVAQRKFGASATGQRAACRWGNSMPWIAAFLGGPTPSHYTLRDTLRAPRSASGSGARRRSARRVGCIAAVPGERLSSWRVRLQRRPPRCAAAVGAPAVGLRLAGPKAANRQLAASGSPSLLLPEHGRTSGSGSDGSLAYGHSSGQHALRACAYPHSSGTILSYLWLNKELGHNAEHPNDLWPDFPKTAMEFEARFAREEDCRAYWRREVLALLLRLGGFLLVLQSSLFDGVAFDPFALEQDGLTAGQQVRGARVSPAAIHEAGHAVVALYLGLVVDWVTLNPPCCHVPGPQDGDDLRPWIVQGARAGS